MYDEDEDFQEGGIDTAHVFYSNLTEESPDLDETPLPFYLQNMFETKKGDSQVLLIDHGDKERGNWESQFQYLLSCIGYAVGLANLWRFPAKVYQGGGGAFLIPYLSFCIIFGGPMMFLEMGLGQFSGQSCSQAFNFCPLLSGIGWTIFLMAFLILINYSIVVSWCLFYFILSFKAILPWSKCTNSFNRPNCFNTSFESKGLTNSSFKSSTIQFWSLYVIRQQRKDGSFYQITDPFGPPNWPIAICLFLVLVLSALIIMFGIKFSGKVIYVTVIFPYIAIIQFVILGCTLPGALIGIKYYLYPNPKKLLDPYIYQSALEQLLFSSGIAAGGLITMSSFNRFKDQIYRNFIIVLFTDFITSFISGFATFPVLGYMAYRTGKPIENLITADTSLFFITFPEALSTISSSNLWSAFFMLMALTLGIDSLFVLLETVIMAISDYCPILHKRRNKIILIITVCLLTFFAGFVLILPGGLHWLAIFEDKMISFVLTTTLIFEVGSVLFIYGIKNFETDIELMTGQKIGLYLKVTLGFFVPIGASVIIFFIFKTEAPINRYNREFPLWTSILGWSCNVFLLSPIFIGALIVLIKYKIRNPNLNPKDYLKLCITQPPNWGPKSKRYWVQSSFYSCKLLKYKNDPVFLASLRKDEEIGKLIKQAENKYGQ